jgi:hypothetical protein
VSGCGFHECGWYVTLADGMWGKAGTAIGTGRLDLVIQQNFWKKQLSLGEEGGWLLIYSGTLLRIGYKGTQVNGVTQDVDAAGIKSFVGEGV